jgi:ribosomal protein S1
MYEYMLDTVDVEVIEMDAAGREISVTLQQI